MPSCSISIFQIPSISVFKIIAYDDAESTQIKKAASYGTINNSQKKTAFSRILQ